MLFLWLILAFVVGVILGRLVSKQDAVGTLKCKYDDPDSGPYLFLAIRQEDVAKIERSKYVTFKVDLSHK